ncbi:fatty acid synthase alpha subunit Lsd1, partial [Coemansia sp. RSA 2681]
PRSLQVVDFSGFLAVQIERNSDGVIKLNIYHQAHSGLTSMCCMFAYQPQQPLAPIHIVVEGRDLHRRKLYIDTWIDNADVPTDSSDIVDVNRRLYSNGFIITKEHVRAFCQNVGNRSMCYAHEEPCGMFAPMDFLVVSTLPNFSLALSSTAVTNDLFKILHMYNRYEIVDGATTLRVGDRVSSDLVIAELLDTPAGRRVKLLINLYRRSQKIATIESAFLYRGDFVDISKSFKHKLDQRFAIQLATADDVAVLKAKEWLLCRDGALDHLVPGSHAEFHLDSLYRFADHDLYSTVLTSGRVFTKSTSGRLVHVADINFECGMSTKDPVVEYLRRYGVAPDVSLFDGEGYSLVSPDSHKLMHVTVPDSNWEYAKLSADGNPIHTNPYIADVAGLPGPITHGLWTSASTRALVECYAANDEPERMRIYQVDFVGMVLPKDQLQTELFHVGMKGGRMLIKGVTSKVGGGPVLECSAEIEQPATAYVFTGQGSQEVGMGMELYKQSAAARDVWDRADRHMLAKYGVSLLKVVRTNPKELTVHFGGRRGEGLRRNYMLLTRRCSSDGGGKVSAIPLFPDITLDSSSHAYRSPTGLLNSTQFTQVILITFAMAVVADMRVNSLVQRDAAFAGHSLGEYAALAAISGMFVFEDILDVTFYRGLLMQSAVKRDTQGRSQYGMLAVDPSRLGGAADESVLAIAIAAISERSKGLLEVVNNNTRGTQYVVAGTLRQLAVLRLVLDAVAKQGAPTDSDWQAHIARIASDVLAKPIDSRPVRGRAAIPLPGIDVPFHSSQLLPGVDEFRALLQGKIRPENIDYSALHRRYIPNLTAEPFEVSREYFSLVYSITQSPIAAGVLDNWVDDAIDSVDEVADLAATLLVELLAYQFASPVQWIDTQDVLFGKLGVRRLIEIGASPILCDMAAKTLKSEMYADGLIELLHIERDRDSVYYTQPRVEIAEPIPSALPAQPEQPLTPVAGAAVEPSAPVVAEVSSSAGAAAAAPLVDIPLQALDVVHAIVAHKTKRSLADVYALKSIKALVGGKSTLQNEIVGNLHKEFGSK